MPDTPPGSDVHRIVSREQIPAMSHEDTGERVVCSCGRSVRSVFRWLIDRWMSDHDALLPGSSG